MTVCSSIFPNTLCLNITNQSGENTYAHSTLEQGRILKHIFKAQDEFPLFSLIERIEICRNTLQINSVNFFLNAKGCKKIKEADENKMKSGLFHHHEFECCKVQVTSEKDLTILIGVLKGHNSSRSKL